MQRKGLDRMADEMLSLFPNSKFPDIMRGLEEGAALEVAIRLDLRAHSLQVAT
jgi:hypothetical protein